jgi:hypothetical protein
VVYVSLLCYRQHVKGPTAHGPLGTICLVLGSLSAGYSWEVVCHLAVRDIVRSSVAFFLCRAESSFLTFFRETRAKLAVVVHHTHFPTMTTSTRPDGLQYNTPDDSEEPDMTKEFNLPVRTHHSA